MHADDLPLHACAHHGVQSLAALRVQAEAAAVAAEGEAAVAEVAAVVAGGGAGGAVTGAAGKGMAWAGAGLLVATCAQAASEALTQVSLVNCLLIASDCQAMPSTTDDR